MTDTNSPRRIGDALTELERRQGEDETRQRQELAEVDQEMESLRKAMAELETQLEAVSRFREEIAVRLDTATMGSSRRTYDTIFAVLREQAQALAGRAADVAEHQRAHRAKLTEALEDAHVKKLLDEYQQFKEHVEPHLASFPETYRAVLETKHNEVQEHLREALGTQVDPPPPLDVPPLAIDVVVALDAPEGVAEVVMMVLPVVEHVQTAWAEREEDLQTWVAARAMQAVYQVCRSFGLPGAQAMYGGHQGLLAVEVELGAGDPAAVRAALKETLDTMCEEATELAGAQLSVVARPVNVDHLFPPEPAEVVVEAQPDAEASHAG